MDKISLILIQLLKGIVYDSNKDAWEQLITHEPDIQAYFKRIGLFVYIDKSEGYAFLKQRDLEEDEEIPRVIERRPLNFHVSLICLLLRKHLLENDAAGTSKRAILKKSDIVEMVGIYLPITNDDVKQQSKIETYINKIIQEGFLRKLDNDEYEINRVIKAFIDADKVEEALQKLQVFINSKKENLL